MSDLTPEQANALLEQAQAELEQGEYNFDDDVADDETADDVADEPKAEPQTEPPSEPKPTDEQISYMQLLAQERAEKLALQQQLAQLQQQNQAPREPPEPKEQEVSLAELFGDFDEAGLQKGIDYLVNQKVNQLLAEKLSPIEQKQAQDIQNEHINAINAMHPDANDIVNSNAFVEWVKAQPSYVIPNIVAVVENGTADQVNELLTNYKATLPKTEPQDDVKAKADKVLGETKTPIPNSLTEMGGAVNTDTMTAVANMGGAEALNAMANWTPEQIENFLNRL